MKSLFEEMGGTYRQEGDYLIPNLVLPDTGDYQIGKYGRMRRNYLKEHRQAFYNTLVLDGTLFKHLSEIDQACNEHMEVITSAMAEQEGMTEAPTSDKKNRKSGLRLFIFFAGFCHQSVKITLIQPVLDNTIFFKLAFSKGFGNGSCDFSFVLQNFRIVELQKRVQLGRPIRHCHGNMPPCLAGGVVQIHSDNLVQFLYLIFG